MDGRESPLAGADKTQMWEAVHRGSRGIAQRAPCALDTAGLDVSGETRCRILSTSVK